ncbi:nucleotidyltransferase family protein [Bradyrhizobium sp. 191]|uniref:nucleotidyltransferase family protein n=1 Tax=Bradyrhizobium sp. 191 TaxID=2782659 RepID=UPI001FFF9204|nr:nucleotidyltransferase family protein [Bradyrhizobium sp. 191]UPJ68989.1 nucleotidyltransferase family protein [Bradyrhizobium sp. 191]
MNRDEFLTLALRNPVNAAIADALAQLALPDAWLVAGCLVQTVWNVLTGRAIGHGIADYDVFYFDPDTSWEAEDAVIRRLHARLAHLGAKIEIRNQARVHLWYPDKHGLPYPPLTCSTDGIDRFLTENTQIGVRRAGESFDVYAPHGFDDVARLIVRPNRAPNFSIANYETKAARWKALWPELTVVAADA